MNYVLSNTGQNTSSDAETVTVLEVEIPDESFGVVSVDVTAAEEDGYVYGFQNSYLVSVDSSVCTIRDDKAPPIELDPEAFGTSVIIDTNGQNFRVQGVGTVGYDLVWGAHIKTLLHERSP